MNWLNEQYKHGGPDQWGHSFEPLVTVPNGSHGSFPVL